MAFQYLTNVPLEKAREEYIDLLLEAGFAAETEVIPVERSCGRISAKAVYAAICAPHYPASAMDGIALSAESTFGAGETSPVTLNEDQFTVVDTGDLIPEGCDAVIMIEDVVRQSDGKVKLFAPAAPWQHIRQIGEDICAGEMILPSHSKISPAAIGSMLAGGVLEVEVIRPIVVGLIPTGDEIVPPTANPKAGDIVEFNSSIFSSMLKEWGAESICFPIVPDKKELLAAAVKEAVEKCDAVVLNAGSSAGREDFSSSVIAQQGGVLYHGIAIRPGKPAILGYCGAKPILGVPGYPVSGIIVMEELMKPIIDTWYCRCGAQAEYAEATLSRSVVSGLKYREFVRVRMGSVGGKLMATPLSRGSGVVSSFMKADGILEIPQGLEGYEAGSKVNVKLLRPRHELDNTLVSIGSHDPLLDELNDMLHLTYPDTFMSSSHVGSMGGIMAVRRGETHIAGVHLLDEADGSYNTAFIKRYFPRGGVRLVECVGRTQGLMLQKGNPLGISSVADLTRAGLRYVNRQKGSGTRILIDYLCKTQGIDPSKIYGYEREEFTHTSVAAQIASGTADAGMGIYSAAKLYDLDFLPVCIEQYDLLIPDYAWDSPIVCRLMEILQSEDFKKRIGALGGYEISNPGSVRERF
ncbi:MAG: molybdopterin biosynthesis protein [Oscillospiraceae bacterium]|nr:molybdopterin biosynthesis protein [Oscillospiraceae bacterium]